MWGDEEAYGGSVEFAAVLFPWLGWNRGIVGFSYNFDHVIFGGGRAPAPSLSSVSLRLKSSSVVVTFNTRSC